MTNREKLVRILEDINPDIDYEKEKELVDDGLFDSLEVMSIVSGMDDTFHIDIDPDDVIAENFNSLDSMLELVEANL